MFLVISFQMDKFMKVYDRLTSVACDKINTKNMGNV